MQKIIKEMIKYFEGDVRRINHALKVYSFADIISKSENLPPKKRRILLTAAGRFLSLNIELIIKIIFCSKKALLN